MKQKIIDTIAEVLGVVPETITPDLSIGDIPAWSSMAQMRLIATLEKRFAVEFPHEDLFDLTNVQTIVEEVEKLKWL